MFFALAVSSLVIVSNLPAPSPSDCNKEKKILSRDQCFLNKAIEAQDKSFCDSIQTQALKENCLQSVVVGEKNPTKALEGVEPDD